jgi:hypothetical protein
VRHTKGRHLKVAQGDGLSLFNVTSKFFGNLLGDTIVAVNACMNLACGIDWQREVGTDGTYRLDVVGMVVCHQHMVYLLQVHAILLAVFAQTSQTYADIYNECIGFRG